MTMKRRPFFFHSPTNGAMKEAIALTRRAAWSFLLNSLTFTVTFTSSATYVSVAAVGSEHKYLPNVRLQLL